MNQSERYEYVKNLAGLGGFLVDALIFVYLIVSGWTLRIRDFAQNAAGPGWLEVLLYVLAVGVVFKLVQLPLSFYSTYVIEHKFGLSRQSLPDWIKDQGKSLLIGAPLTVAGVEIIYYLLRTQPERWWIYMSAVFVVFFVVMANLAPVVLLPLFFKFRRVENSDLNRRVNRLAERTRTPVCGVFEWSLGEKTRKANAAVVGWGNTRRIIVSDTLLENFLAEEIEVILAHELCHHARNHIWQTMTLQAALTFASFYAAHRFLVPLSDAFGFQSISDVANFPLLVLILTAVSLFVLPAVNYFSRRLETAADLYALDVTGDSLAFVSSMEKLSRLNLVNNAPNKIIEFIFYSHPSIEDRIKLAADRVGQIV